METQKHPNSKKVTIFRAGSFINDAQSGAQEYMSMSKQSIGPYWASINSKGVGIGLNFNEQNLLLPLVLDIPKEDRNFREGIKKFYSAILTQIPYGKGREVEIGLLLDNSKPVTYKNENGEENLPINITDYIRYRHAIGHPQVAPNKETAQGNSLLKFYIFDPETAQKANTTKVRTKDEALKAYFAVKDDEDKVDAMLTLLLIDPRTFNSKKNAADLKQETLREKADSNADQFVKIYTQEHFQEKYTIQSMVNTSVLKKIGDRYVDAETSDVIGNTLEETIYFLLDDTKTQEVGILKSKLQEALKPAKKKTAAAK